MPQAKRDCDTVLLPAKDSNESPTQVSSGIEPLPAAACQTSPDAHPPVHICSSGQWTPHAALPVPC